MNSLLNQTPPDDTGTDTLKRFRYQAQLALPFCLECAHQDQGKVRSVILEHFEDIVVEYEDHWQFIQVKTRNANLGPWKLTDAMHGLRSLYRAFKEISHSNARYSLFVEGAISAQNDLSTLLVSREVDIDIPDTVVKKVAGELSIAEPECKAFLKMVTVHSNQTGRADITAHNIRLMGQISSNTTAKEIEALEQRLTDEILRAMSCDRLENLLYQYIAQTDAFENKNRVKINAKRLMPENIIAILGSLTSGDYPLLRRITDLNVRTPTNLEKKLIAGGATEPIIRNAIERRADASHREYEILASGFCDEESKIEDVQARVETLAIAVVEECKELGKPASSIWRELLKELTQNVHHIDPNHMYKQDPYLLLGAVCGLSDECRIDWGVKIA